VSRRVLLMAVLVVIAVGVAWARRSSAGSPIAWLHDEGQAFSESQRTGKPVLVDAWAQWCAACTLLDRNTWSDARVQREVRARFVPLRIDFTTEGTVADGWRKTYGIDGLPTVLSCRAPGCPADAENRSTGYLRPAEMLSFLASQS
jgi:thiol:disulfide interchange protein DsbD